MQTHSLKGRLAAIAAGWLGLVAGGSASAESFQIFIDQVVTPPSAVVTGTAPWLDVTFADTATPGTVAVTVSASLSGSQTLTGLWFNLPTAAGAITSVSITDTDGNGSGEIPMAFAAINAAPSNTESALHAIQDLHPTGTTRAQVGDYNLLFRFANNAGSAFQVNETETFNLVSNVDSGLSAASFRFGSSPTAGGAPNPAYYAVASFTNSGGTGGSGTAYIASAVPESDALTLLLAGLGAAGFIGRIRKTD